MVQAVPLYGFFCQIVQRRRWTSRRLFSLPFGLSYWIVTGNAIVCVSVPAVAVMLTFVLPVITSVMAIDVLVALCLSPL